MIGETLGSYRIVGRVGTGGMGEVYLAQHTRIDRRAAIKVLLPELSHNQDVVDRFFAEARATSSIRHPGIVEVFDCDIHPGGRAYIVMELLEGESLAARLARDPVFGNDAERVLDVTGAVADAVAAAHAKGIVHRDLKPDNIFLAGHTGAPLGFAVKILDFGIAKLMGGDGDGGGRGASLRTRTGSLLGTPAYMSPEQCRGASRVDHRTDVYSLGCIVFEMFAGRRPFMYEGFGELISAHLTETPPALAQLGIAVAPEIERWLQRLLAKSPDDRVASMKDVAASLARLRGLPPPVARVAATAGGTAVMPIYGDEPPPGNAGPTPSPVPTALLPATPRTTTTTTLSENAAELGAPRPRSRPRAPWAWGAGAAALLALAGGGGALLRRPRTARQPEAATTPAVEPRAPETVTLAVIDPPAQLTVTLDGSPAALPLRLPAGPQTHALVFRAPGYQPRTLHADGTQSRHLTLALEPIAPPTPERLRTSAPPPATAPAGRDRADDRRRRAPRSPRPAELTDDARKL